MLTLIFRLCRVVALTDFPLLKLSQNERHGIQRIIGTLASDLSRVDAHEMATDEYDDLPELTDDIKDKTIPLENGKPVRRDRASVSAPMKQVTTHPPADIVKKWKATGPGWQPLRPKCYRSWGDSDDNKRRQAYGKRGLLPAVPG
jgi:uncharacterized protein (DUF4415 family)